MKILSTPIFTLVLAVYSITLSAQSTILWHRSYDSGTSDEGKHILLNNQGSVYVAGLSTFGPSKNVISLKYDSTGTLVFAYKCNPELPGDLVKIERALSYNIYALTSIPLSGGDMAYSVSKYTSSGTFRFQFNSGDSSGYRFTPVDFAIDNAENIIVAGTYENFLTGTASGFFIKQLSVNGVDKWTKTFAGSGKTQLVDITLDNSNNIYVCGGQGLTANAGDFLIQKYNPNGVVQWTKTYNGTAGQMDKAEKIVVDNTTGNVYVAGTTNYSNGSTQSNNALVKYNASGVRQWQKVFGHTGINQTKEILFDVSGNAYLIGDAIDINNPSGDQPSRIFATKFSAGGTQQWLRVHNNGNFVHEYAKAAVCDNSGNLFIGAEIKDSASFVSDMLAYKLSNAGNKRWEQRGNGTAGENDYVSAITKDANNNIYLTGRNGNASYDARTTRIADKVVTCGAGSTQICYLFKTRCVANADLASFISKGAVIGPCIGLKQTEDLETTINQISIYPNPSKNSFTIALPENASVSISILDLTGREVFFSIDLKSNDTFGEELKEGIYLAKISSPSETKIIKLVKSN